MPRRGKNMGDGSHAWRARRKDVAGPRARCLRRFVGRGFSHDIPRWRAAHSYALVLSRQVLRPWPKRTLRRRLPASVQFYSSLLPSRIDDPARVVVPPAQTKEGSEQRESRDLSFCASYPSLLPSRIARNSFKTNDRCACYPSLKRTPLRALRARFPLAIDAVFLAGVDQSPQIRFLGIVHNGA